MDPREDTTWMEAGRCRDMHPSVFFPHDGAGVEHARLICARCVVRWPCLDYALDHRIAHGVWGGTSERERVRILETRRLTPRGETDRHLGANR